MPGTDSIAANVVVIMVASSWMNFIGSELLTAQNAACVFLDLGDDFGRDCL